jgi:BR serine/threonine kinase
MCSSPPSPQTRPAVGRYVLSETLGEGSASKVKLGIDRETGEKVAVKIISTAVLAEHPDLEIKVHREIALMRLVNHPNVLRIIGVLESRKHIYLVLEYAEKGELFNFLLSKGLLPEQLALDIFRQILLAVESLHHLGICHRDLKLENILLDSYDRVKLADFGFARWVSSNLSSTACGSPHYCAPEVLSCNPYDGRIADVWSLGVILYTLVAGSLPFEDPSVPGLLRKVRQGQFPMPRVRPDLQDLIARMLIVKPGNRITIPQVKSHPGFRIGLPPTYVLPCPLPFAECRGPSRLPLSEDITLVLLHIGFTQESINLDMENPEFAMAKVFVELLSTDFEVEKLRWDLANSGPPNPPVRAIVELPEFDATSGERHDLTRASQVMSAKSPESYSMIVRPAWMSVEADLPRELSNIVRLEITERSSWDVMGKIQILLGGQPFFWFHPDPATMYVRSGDGHSYFSIVCTFLGEGNLNLAVTLLKGADDDFTPIAEHIAGLFLD